MQVLFKGWWEMVELTHTEQDVLKSWKKFGIETSLGDCSKCGEFGIRQHQEICLSCMTKNANITEEIEKRHAGKCQVCDRKSKDNVCAKCLRGMF